LTIAITSPSGRDDVLVYRPHDEDHLVGSGSAKIYPLESSRDAV
jgi:hypothetical protein